MSNKSNPPVATMGIDIGKNAFHVVGLDRRGMILLRQRWSRGQLEGRLANMPQCLIGMEPTRCGPVSNSSEILRPRLGRYFVPVSSRGATRHCRESAATAPPDGCAPAATPPHLCLPIMPSERSADEDLRAK